MLIWIIPRNDGSGIVPEEARDGDILQAKPDSWEPNIGTQEKKSFLILKLPDPPNLEAVMPELESAEYEPGPEGPVVKHAHRWRVEWRPKFSAAEVAAIEDGNATLPDGTTQGGGSVTNGVVSALFDSDDLQRK